jgi:rubrerythrin
MKPEMNELLQQMLETERGGILIYRAALECAVNPDLKKEWTEYLAQTERHERVVQDLFAKLGIEEEETPGRLVVKHIGDSLVMAMNMAKRSAPAEAAELVACECVVFAETKDHLNWTLLSQCAEEAKGDVANALKEACEEVEDEEDEHIYHSKGWCRELWISALGMDAVLPPPEEQKDVKTAIGAARAEQARKDLM